MYEKALLAAGLNRKQASMYLACLELGSAKVPEIAKNAQIKRTTAYGLIDELVSLGLLQPRYKGKTKVYSAQDPEKLLNLSDERNKKITDVMPELSELFFSRYARPKISFFEGREGLKKIYDDILECTSKEVRQIVRVRDHIATLGNSFTKEYIRKRVERGIVAYDLHPKSGDIYNEERGTTSQKLKRHVRYLPENVFHAAMIMIYDNKVAMVSTTEENFGFIIVSKQFSSTLKAYFDFMWGLGSKEPE